MGTLSQHVSREVSHTMQDKSKPTNPGTRKETNPSKHHNDTVGSRGPGSNRTVPSNDNTASTP